MKSSHLIRWIAMPAVALACGSAFAQDVVLRIHHFLPPAATIQAKFLTPWCEKLGKESNGRIKCQIYPAMQLGGTPPQLFDQARDGVADIVWSLPTYQAGRFTKSEVFELPFMAKSGESGSPALWDYIHKNALDEFKGTKLLAAHLHDGSLFHFTTKDVKSMEDLKGLKIRAPSRIGTKFLQALGATPVQMPLPQIPEALSKSVIDGAMVPWEGAAHIKLAEITKYHFDNAPGQPKMSNSIFVLAMNQAKYDSLPPDLKKVLDANSGAEASRQIGRAFDATTIPNRKVAEDYKGVFTNLSPAEYAKWQKALEPVAKEWIQEANAKGANGAALLEEAKALISKHGG